MVYLFASKCSGRLGSSKAAISTRSVTSRLVQQLVEATAQFDDATSTLSQVLGDALAAYLTLMESSASLRPQRCIKRQEKTDKRAFQAHGFPGQRDYSRRPAVN
jgi:hypothetical protein